MFSPLEMAVIVSLSDKTLKEKHSAYEEIIAEYHDIPIQGNISFDARDSLHGYLREWIGWEETLREMFYAPADGLSCRFSVMWMGENEWSDYGSGVYSSVNNAWLACCKEYEACNDDIAKVKIQRERLDCEDDNYFTADMNQAGELLDIIMYGTRIDALCDLSSIYINLPVPFENGDLLTDNNGKPWVLLKMPHWHHPLEYEPGYKDYVMGKYGDGSNVVARCYTVTCNEDGDTDCYFNAAHNLWWLRYYTGELPGMDRFLKHLSRYIKEKGKNIDWLLSVFREYRAEAEHEDWVGI